MKPRTIGIIGGAGPLAGALLFETILSKSRKIYGCYRDQDFPKIFLLSYPFSEMLSCEFNAAIVQQELREALQFLRQNGAEVLSIACNTLHAFLEGEMPGLISLPRELAREIPPGKPPLVLCTSTSVKFALHKRFFPCIYPAADVQREIDAIIDGILKGGNQKALVRKLINIIKAQAEETIILGCTELSLLAPRLMQCKKTIIDPLEIAAEKIVKISFEATS
jgi:aspartate racemase